MNDLEKFVNERMHRYPGAKCKFITLHQMFVASLTPNEQKWWPRCMVMRAIRKIATVGKGSDKVLYVAGFSFTPPPIYQVDDRGRLILRN